MRTPAYDKKIAAVWAEFANKVDGVRGEVWTNDREGLKRHNSLVARVETATTCAESALRECGRLDIELKKAKRDIIALVWIVAGVILTLIIAGHNMQAVTR